jgi:tRNA (guanosine-2'-O-)-methyltransferase
MTPERLARIQSVLDRRQTNLTVVTDQLVKERNLAAIVRTCDAVGVNTLHCVDPEHEYRRYRGTSASADKWVCVERYSSVDAPLSMLRESGFQIVAANLCERSCDYRDIDYTQPTALVMGAEIEGISQQAEPYVDQHIVIPMMGMVESFNVSVAAAIILSEARNQREHAGLYDKPELTKEQMRTLILEWGYPKVVEYCDSRGIERPQLDEDGYLRSSGA